MVPGVSGCKVDGEEEMEIHADGTLTMRVNYQFPELGLGQGTGGIYTGELSCERVGNATVRLIAEIHSKDAVKLREIMDSELEMLEVLIEQRG